jgi:hypothetical protein
LTVSVASRRRRQRQTGVESPRPLSSRRYSQQLPAGVESPRPLDRLRLAALLGFASLTLRCLRRLTGSSGRPLSVPPVVVCSAERRPCPSPGRTGLAARGSAARSATRSRPGNGWSAGRFRDQEARGRHPRGGRERSERAGTPRRPRGEVWGHPARLEPPRTNARCDQQQGGTERGRSLGVARTRQAPQRSEERSRRPRRREAAGRAGPGGPSERGLSTGVGVNRQQQ